METFLLALSATFTIISIIPYIIDVVKRRTKPRVVSWFNWSLLTGIATAAAFADKQYASAILTLAATVQTAAVVLLAFRHGTKQFEPFDIVCEVGALVGLLFWLIFNSPITAIVATVSIDFIAALPTAKHAWQKPQEETAVTFVLSSLGALCAVLAGATTARMVGLIYPVYLVLMNGIVALEIVVLQGSRTTTSRKA